MTHFVTRATPIEDIDSKSHKTSQKSSRDYSTSHLKSKSHLSTSYLWPQGRTHTHAYTNTLAE